MAPVRDIPCRSPAPGADGRMFLPVILLPVIPAQAGIHVDFRTVCFQKNINIKMDPGLRWDDGIQAAKD